MMEEMDPGRTKVIPSDPASAIEVKSGTFGWDALGHESLQQPKQKRGDGHRQQKCKKKTTDSAADVAESTPVMEDTVSFKETLLNQTNDEVPGCVNHEGSCQPGAANGTAAGDASVPSSVSVAASRYISVLFDINLVIRKVSVLVIVRIRFPFRILKIQLINNIASFQDIVFES